MSCGVGHRRGSDPALLWRWRRPVATAPIGHLAWEPPYAMGATLEKPKRQKKKKLGKLRAKSILLTSMLFYLFQQSTGRVHTQ